MEIHIDTSLPFKNSGLFHLKATSSLKIATAIYLIKFTQQLFKKSLSFIVYITLFKKHW